MRYQPLKDDISQKIPARHMLGREGGRRGEYRRSFVRATVLMGRDYDQITIFDLALPQFCVGRKIRLIELFAGVGSQAMALRDMGVDFERYRISEWEVSANRSYKAIHYPGDSTDYSRKFRKFKWLARVLSEYGISADGKTKLTLKQIRRKGEKWCRRTYNELRANHNIGDIANAHALDLQITNTESYCYILTYSFPCQDLSMAGKQKGMAKGSGTRSGLLWEVERLLNECGERPQVLLMENVPQVHSKENMPDFQKWMGFLESKGYSNYWQDLNARDYGVAQNRNRCFMVSLFGEWNYKFPQPIPLKRMLKDYLEDEVGEKYYINNEKAQKLIQALIENGTLWNDCDFEMDGNFNQRGKVHGEGSICRTILGNGHAGNEPKVLSVGNLNPSGNGINGNVYAGNLSPTITTNKSEGTKICVDLSLNGPNKKTVSNCIMTKGDRGISNQRSVGNGVVEIEVQKPMIVAMRGRIPGNPSDRAVGIPTRQRLELNRQGICNTLTSVQKDNLLMEAAYRIRKLTPLECWRLMGFSDGDFRKAEEVNSNTKLYKQAGNSLVKIVMIAILSQLNIKGAKDWNSMSLNERNDVVGGTG